MKSKVQKVINSTKSYNAKKVYLSYLNKYLGLGRKMLNAETGEQAYDILVETLMSKEAPAFESITRRIRKNVNE